MANERELGEIQARLSNLENDVRDIKSGQKELNEYLHGARGAWKAIAVAGTIVVSALSILSAKIWEKIFG